MAEPGREDQRARPRPPHRPTGADGQPPLLSAHYPEPTAAGAALLSRTSCPIRRPLINVIYLVLRVVTMETEQINYACPECNHLGHAWIPGASIPVELENPTTHPDGTVSFFITIECAG